jgi:hypothetical protein
VRALADRLLLVLLAVDSVILAGLEVFFLPLRFDGQLLPNWGAFPFPVTVVLAAVANPWLALRTAALTRRMLVVLLPFLLWLATIGGLGLTSTGENMILLPDWRTLLLLAAGSLPTAVTLGNISARLRTERLDREPSPA